MTDRELMQMALDALIETVRLAGEYGTHLIRNDKDAGHAYTTIEALRARLAQPEPEPNGYLWFTRHMEQRFTHRKPKEDERIGDVKPIYTAPPQREWQGLTDEEIDELAEANLDFNWKDGVEDFARAIEAKLKEKNNG